MQKCAVKKDARKGAYTGKTPEFFPVFPQKAGETPKTRACERQDSGKIGGYPNISDTLKKGGAGGTPAHIMPEVIPYQV